MGKLPHQGQDAEQKVHGGGWTCAALHCACRSPRLEHGQGGGGGARQGGSSSSQRYCRPSCPVGCHLWTSTASLDHPTEQKQRDTGEHYD